MTKQLRTLWLALSLALFSLPSLAAEPIGILRGMDGSFHSLSEYTGQGKWTVVMLWASYCPTCNAEAKNYVKFHAEHSQKDAVMLGISIDGAADKAEAQAFINRHKVNFPNLIGEPEQVAGLYSQLTGKQWIGTPSFLIFNPKGELRAAQAGAVPTLLIEDFIDQESKDWKDETAADKVL